MVAALATGVLALGGIGAFVYAVRTYVAQSAQLELARDEMTRLRAPVLRGVIDLVDHGGIAKFRLDVWLSTSEPLASLRVIIEEARAHDCPLGFTTGQIGVEQSPDQTAVPPGWRNDVLRHEARWDELLLPGTSATWQMVLRSRDAGADADASKVRLRAECTAVSGGKPWRVEVPVAVTKDAADRLLPVPGAQQ